MQRQDLRKRIIPTTLENSNYSWCKEEDKKSPQSFNTKDQIYLESEKEVFVGKHRILENLIVATDFAKINGAYIDSYNTFNGEASALYLLRSNLDPINIHYINTDGSLDWENVSNKDCGICPSLHYSFQVEENISTTDQNLQIKEDNLQNTETELNFDAKAKNRYNIKEVKNKEGKVIFHTLQIGEYPQTKINEELSQILEEQYNGGNLQDGIKCTGRWYSVDGQIYNNEYYAGKHCPEFEYEGNRYVRVISYARGYVQEEEFSDGTIIGKNGTIRWIKVEPISFIIKNWDEMPKNINPQGSGIAKNFELRSEKAITSNIPFHPKEECRNAVMWQNSTIRGFLNGIDVRYITQNGNEKYGTPGGGDFSGECNFLNEAFNLARKPIIEYTIPDSEVEIPNDGFNGCVTLKKLTLHSNIIKIGKRAFDGLNFKYVYKNKNNKIVFSQELPQNKEEYLEFAEISKITKTFSGFDYNIFAQCKNLKQIVEFSQYLEKNRFSIPYIYALRLIETGKAKDFWKNNDFRFFKNEIPNINEKLLKFSQEERLDFFKFAKNLGCFSKEKIIDKNGKETQVIMAQKASSLLFQILKIEEMKLRKIP